MNWTTYLLVAEFAHNTWYNAMMKTSPFRLLMGYEPRATWEITKSPLPQITTRLDQMIEARQVAYEARRLRKPHGNDAHTTNGSKKENRCGWKDEIFTCHTPPQS